MVLRPLVMGHSHQVCISTITAPGHMSPKLKRKFPVSHPIPMCACTSSQILRAMLTVRWLVALAEDHQAIVHYWEADPA